MFSLVCGAPEILAIENNHLPFPSQLIHWSKPEIYNDYRFGPCSAHRLMTWLGYLLAAHFVTMACQQKFATHHCRQLTLFVYGFNCSFWPANTALSQPTACDPHEIAWQDLLGRPAWNGPATAY